MSQHSTAGVLGCSRVSWAASREEHAPELLGHVLVLPFLFPPLQEILGHRKHRCPHLTHVWLLGGMKVD